MGGSGRSFGVLARSSHKHHVNVMWVPCGARSLCFCLRYLPHLYKQLSFGYNLLSSNYTKSSRFKISKKLLQLLIIILISLVKYRWSGMKWKNLCFFSVEDPCRPWVNPELSRGHPRFEPGTNKEQTQNQETKKFRFIEKNGDEVDLVGFLFFNCRSADLSHHQSAVPARRKFPTFGFISSSLFD